MDFFYCVLADQVKAITLGMMKIITGTEMVAMGVITTTAGTDINMEVDIKDIPKAEDTTAENINFQARPRSILLEAEEARISKMIQNPHKLS